MHLSLPARRSTLAALLLALLAAGCARGAPRAPAPAPGAVRFLLVNDVYVLDTLRDGSGGLARVARLRDSLARDGGAIFVLAGDVLSPSLLSKWFGGRQMVEGFNAARLEYATFGNHEFELPRDTLIARIAASRFRWLSANCTQADSASTPFPGVRPWDTLTVHGTRVGIFGVTLQGGYARYVRCADPDTAAHRAIAELRRAGAMLVVGLTHQNVEADSALLAREPDLDLILGGHEHTWHRVTVAGRRVLKADANSRSAQVVAMRPGSGLRWLAFDTLVAVGRGMPDDAHTARVVAAWRDTLVRRLGPERIVGVLPAPLDLRDGPLRSQETPFGDLVADAMRAGTGADVALINGGAMRLDDIIRAGPVSSWQIESAFLFADETRAITFPLTGARLREVLEQALTNANYGRGGYLQLSGVTFDFDLSRPERQRIVGDLRRPDGRPIAPGDTLTVAFVTYPACLRGDGYDIPEARDGDACRQAGSAPRTVDLLLRHLRSMPGDTITIPPVNRVRR
ncbi:MAG TPA: bifunctional metallophosphatase/5'-nucleotidase, partial [Gemmatimonadaceae bacterium]|nr:bifunctional metallophosphatase/5'-nucleotidase [Gemmatimonadaceae bacterium]